MWGTLPTFFVFTNLPRRNVKDELEVVAREELDGAGYDLVELRRGGTRSRPLLEVRIDRRDGQPVTVEDCATASRRLEARLDAGRLVAEQYVLQVSSPGDRPLRDVKDWRRFIGRWVNVLAPAQGGRFEAKIEAVEGEDGAEVIVVQPDKRPPLRIPLADVKEARLAFRWER